MVRTRKALGRNVVAAGENSSSGQLSVQVASCRALGTFWHKSKHSGSFYSSSPSSIISNELYRNTFEGGFYVIDFKIKM